MTIHEEKSAGYITLKEASERFGYAPDYIGQLIRKGKIEGKQVYANVAWMTTEVAMSEYVAALAVQSSEKRTGKTDISARAFSLDRFMEALFTEKMTRVYAWGMRGALVVLLAALAFVFYFLSIAIDHKLTRVAEAHLDERMSTITPSSAPSNVSDLFARMTYEQ